MVILLNLIVPVVLLISGLIAWKLKKPWIVLIGIGVVLVYGQLQPSYTPKGEVRRSQVPVFESSDAEIQDRQRRAQDGSAYDKKRQDSIKEGLPFIQK